ncbi:Enamine deaminase RidA, house cleaning of reactive enamine intermediates, YjgF/YER057c/UK114 family [Spirosomataceae bacterium TFI 002]|nr:Enamine deaminase RidA, house cleaning of reactive enamine intermediates, YjgF/YER057c/UK114 family [Spirosomataceae bacterium TFI 002]
MTKRQNLTTNSAWEDKVGYCRAVKIGNTIEVSGTVSVDNSGEVVGLNDPYIQTRFILLRIENALKSLGATMQDIVRTRVYVTDISKWELVGKAHGEMFADIKPAMSMVEVSALINPDYIVEIEATVILGGN